jgi:hypothetical protein
MMSFLKMATVQEKCAYFGCSKESPLSGGNFVTELNLEKTHLQTKLSDAG